MTVISKISSTATGEPDFTTLSAWEVWGTANYDGTESYIAQIYDDFGANGLLDGCQIAGWSGGNATFPIIVEAAPGHKHTGVPNSGARITNGIQQVTIDNRQRYSIIRDIEIHHLAANGVNRRALQTHANAVQMVTTERCIITSDTTNIGIYAASISAAPNTFRNNVVVCKTAGRAFNATSPGDVTSSYDNNTIYGGCVFTTGDVNFSISNNAFHGDISNQINPLGTATNNAFEAGQPNPFGANQVNTLDDTDFEDSANNDYRPSAGSDLIGAGADLSGQFTDDILGNTRVVPWEIGAFEDVAAGPTPPIVDAGGPYSGTVGTPIALDSASVSPGSDPSPTLLWSIVSGGTGTFSNDSIVNPTFTPDSEGQYVLRLSADPNDGDPVTDDTTLDSQGLPISVQLGQAKEVDSASAWSVQLAVVVQGVQAKEVDRSTSWSVQLPVVVQGTQAKEIDSATSWTATSDISVQLTQAKEVDAALPWTATGDIAVQLGQAKEVDRARQWLVQGLPIFIQLGQAKEVDTAAPWSVVNPNAIQLGQAQEADTAFPWGSQAPIAVQLTQAKEIDFATSWRATYIQEIQLRQSVEYDTAFPYIPYISEPAGDYDYFRPRDYRNLYDRFLGPLSQEVVLLFNNGIGFTRLPGVFAHVSRWKENDLVPNGPIELGDLKLIIRANTIPSFPRTPDQRDRIEINGRPYGIILWDEHTRSIGDQLMAVEATVRG